MKKIHIPSASSQTGRARQVDPSRRRRDDGTSSSTAQKQAQGAVMVQSLLDEQQLGVSFEEWTNQVIRDGPDSTGAYPAVARMWAQLLAKASADEPLVLRAGSADEVRRPLRRTHPQEIIFALRKQMNSALADGLAIARGHFQLYAPYEQLTRRLGALTDARRRSAGDEHKQRRNLCFHDEEQVELFASVLRGDVEDRHPIDALTLLVVSAAYFAIGKRGMSLDAMAHGYLNITKWSTEVWEGVTPLVLQACTPSKGDRAGEGVKHREEIMHHRCPMRCAICALGHYFFYQFLVCLDELPQMDAWLETMHRRPLLRKVRGGAAQVTDFNAELRKNLVEIGADPTITFHFLRDVRIAEAGERGDAKMDILSGAGHSSGSSTSHNANYKAVVRSWVLGGAGYRSDPEVQGAWVRAYMADLECARYATAVRLDAEAMKGEERTGEASAAASAAAST